MVDFHHRVILRAKNRTEKIEKMYRQITSTEKVLSRRKLFKRFLHFDSRPLTHVKLRNSYHNGRTGDKKTGTYASKRVVAA